MFREGPLHIATSLCHRTPSKPHSTSMINLVVLTRTCLNMLYWEFLNSNIVYNGCKTYHVQGKACFSMTFIGFQWFSAWWHCSSSWSALVPPTSASGPFTSEDVSGATEDNIVVLTVGSFGSLWLATLRTWTSMSTEAHGAYGNSW